MHKYMPVQLHAKSACTATVFSTSNFEAAASTYVSLLTVRLLATQEAESAVVGFYEFAFARQPLKDCF